jgi:hypothetical protein
LKGERQNFYIGIYFNRTKSGLEILRTHWNTKRNTTRW